MTYMLVAMSRNESSPTKVELLYEHPCIKLRSFNCSLIHATFFCIEFLVTCTHTSFCGMVAYQAFGIRAVGVVAEN